MLSKIFIQNFALIERLEIDLHKGLQVITGETGAGKSIILGALRLILGERVGSNTPSDNQKSIVEATFVVSDDLKILFDNQDVDFDPETIIRREILPTGKSRAFINDVPVTLDVLKTIANRLVDIHSQFETSQLFSQEFQFAIIDGLSKKSKTVKDYQEAFAEYQLLTKQLETLKKQLSEGNKETDYKQFLLTELQEAQLDETDWENLQNQLSVQENAETISENLSEILTRFDQEEIGLLDALLDVKSKLAKLGQLSHHFAPISERFNENFVELKDLLFELQNEAEKIETNPEILDQLNQKINLINALFLKHQVNTLPELVVKRDQLAGEQMGYTELENYIRETEEKIQVGSDILSKITTEITANRKKAAPVFKKQMEQLLQKLGLEKANIEVKLDEDASFNSFGKDRITILFQANVGFPLKPIQEAISGGERSRVMLAIKKIMAENSQLPTLILDEIDTGVSGKIAAEMGQVMQEMGKNMQLIIITHLAQVAAKGQNNYKVVKHVANGKTQTNIVALNGEEKLKEIAQLLSGSEVTDAAMKQAQELMKI